MAGDSPNAEFVFSNKHEDILPTLLGISAFIAQQLPQHKQTLLPKVKLVVIELLTNAIKHCGHREVLIELKLQDDFLVVTKADGGRPFYLSQIDEHKALAWPIDTGFKNTTIKIYGDGLNALFAKIINECELSFYTEEYDPDKNEISDISEHFGLMIITRLTSDFRYRYDKNTQSNYFTMKLPY